MWTAKVYPLALLIAVFSGAWPYIKIMMIFVSWVVPPKYLSVKRRGGLLQILDTFGKWSLIDAYVLVMMMVAFHLHIATPAHMDMLPDDFLNVQVQVNPHWGFYGFLLAAVWALAVNHAAIAYHRDAVSVEHDDKQRRRRTMSQPLLDADGSGAFSDSAAGSASPWNFVAGASVPVPPLNSGINGSGNPNRCRFICIIIFPSAAPPLPPVRRRFRRVLILVSYTKSSRAHDVCFYPLCNGHPYIIPILSPR